MFFWILIFDPNSPFCQGYSLCTMADFQNRLISGKFGVFSEAVDFAQILPQLYRPVRDKESFLMQAVFFTELLIFDPNWPFCQGYSLCTMADFQNRLISGIFGVFSSGFLHRTTLMWLKNRFSHVFLNFNFWPKLTILPRL